MFLASLAKLGSCSCMELYPTVLVYAIDPKCVSLCWCHAVCITMSLWYDLKSTMMIFPPVTFLSSPISGGLYVHKCKVIQWSMGNLPGSHPLRKLAIPQNVPLIHLTKTRNCFHTRSLSNTQLLTAWRVTLVKIKGLTTLINF